MKTSRFPAQPCLSCGTVNDAADRLEDDATPEPGAVFICLYCHHIMIYGEGQVVRNPTDDEMLEIAGDADVLKYMRALGAFKAWEAKKP